MPKILSESLENVTQDNAELKAQVSMLRDALIHLLEEYTELNKTYARYALLKTQKEIGKGVVHCHE